MPLTWEQKERLVEQGVCTAMTFAQGCRRFPDQNGMKGLLKELRVATKRGIAGELNMSMNVEMFHTLLARGHRSDPHQAADYEALVNIWRVTEDRERRAQVREVYDLARQDLDGPASRLRQIAGLSHRLSDVVQALLDPGRSPDLGTFRQSAITALREHRLSKANSKYKDQAISYEATVHRLQELVAAQDPRLGLSGEEGDEGKGRTERQPRGSWTS